MDVSTTSAATPATSSAASSAKASGSAVLTSDFQTFLRMLTTQMQNQDPLNPIDSTDYAVQLATFAGVEQQVRTNQMLEAFSSQFSLMGMSQLAGWVGQDARAAAPVWFDGDPVTLSPNLAANADSAVLVVKNAAGTVVAREQVPTDGKPFEWLGTDDDGDPLPDGTYRLTLESWKGESKLREDPVEYYGRVIEARGGANGVRLVFEGGIEVPASAVTALRAAQD